MSLSLARDGAQHFPSALPDTTVSALRARLAGLSSRPGTRLSPAAGEATKVAPVARRAEQSARSRS